MIALVSTAAGTFAVDLDTEEVTPYEAELEPVEIPILNLPRLVAAAAAGCDGHRRGRHAAAASRVARRGHHLARVGTRACRPGAPIAIAADDPTARSSPAATAST